MTTFLELEFGRRCISALAECIIHLNEVSNSMKRSLEMDRSRFLRVAGLTTAALATGEHQCVGLETPPIRRAPSLDHQIGIVTASAHAQLTGRATGRKFTLLELPNILRNELDLRIVDLNTSSFPDFATVDRPYLDKLRNAVADAGCVMTNLKMNQRGIDMNSTDRNARERALAEYKRSIDIASQLGCHWARPLPSKKKPDMAIHVASFRELCDYAAQRNVMLLVENFGWLQSRPSSVADLIQAIGANVAAGVDTGNWNGNDIRYAGLEKSFPLAVTCDFKARTLGAGGEHREYDLRRCFDIAWASGFRGPWALEHANPDTRALLKGCSRLRDMLRNWTADASGG